MDNKQSTINNKKDFVLERSETFAHLTYIIARKLLKHELFGLTSQLRRAALSVPLNVVEGYARQSKKSEAQFLSIAFGSLKEAQFILRFAVKENYVEEQEISDAMLVGDEAAKLIWVKTQTLRKQFQSAN